MTRIRVTSLVVAALLSFATVAAAQVPGPDVRCLTLEDGILDCTAPSALPDLRAVDARDVGIAHRVAKAAKTPTDKMDRTLSVLRWTHIGLQAADIAQTNYILGGEAARRALGLPARFEEGNPVLRPLSDSPIGMTTVKIGYAYGLDKLIKYLSVDKATGEHHHKRAVAMYLAAIGTQAIVVTLNQRTVNSLR